MFPPVYIILDDKTQPTTHSSPMREQQGLAKQQVRNFRNRSCILQREGNCLISPEKKALFRVTSGIQYSAQLAWANTGTVISHRRFQSTHPVHLESPEWGGNPAGRGQWCPLRAAISSMLAVEAQAPLGLSQQCQEGWVPQVQAAHLGWDLLGFSSKHAWVNTRFCPSLRLSFTQTTPSCEGRSGSI